MACGVWCVACGVWWYVVPTLVTHLPPPQPRGRTLSYRVVPCCTLTSSSSSSIVTIIVIFHRQAGEEMVASLQRQLDLELPKHVLALDSSKRDCEVLRADKDALEEEKATILAQLTAEVTRTYASVEVTRT